ncbi:unnamed protein product, partial [Allacma fusca]
AVLGQAGVTKVKESDGDVITIWGPGDETISSGTINSGGQGNIGSLPCTCELTVVTSDFGGDKNGLGNIFESSILSELVEGEMTSTVGI